MINKIKEKTTYRARNLFPINLTKAIKNKHLVVLDTETIGNIKQGEKAYPYDISYVSMNKGKVIHQKCYINKDIFDDKYKIGSAYYSCKIPTYKKRLKEDRNNIFYQKVNDFEILGQLNKYIKDNNIKYFLAYNSDFDYKSINNLYDLVEMRNCFKSLRQIDIWKVCTDILEKDKELFTEYHNFCKINKLITESGKNIGTSADNMGKFLLQDTSFEEEHTGLEDSKLELMILVKMLERYKKDTGKDYYYKLDTRNSGGNKKFRDGTFAI